MELLVERLQQTSAESGALWRVDERSSIARRYEDTSVTFAELFAWTSVVCDSLQQPSLPLIVGIALPPCSIEESALVLACVREKQWTYVPIDVTLPLAQQLFMLQDARVNALVTLRESAIAQFLTENTGDFLESAPRKVASDAPEVFRLPSVFSLTPSVAAAPELLVQSDSDSDDEAPLYILYTSGSTGHPKGVLGTRRGALNRLQWMWQQFPFSSRNEERVVRVTKLSFVDSVWEILGALLMGIPLVHLQKTTASQPAAGHAILSELFLQTIEKFQVSRFTVVPSVLEVLLLKYSTSAYSALKELLQRALMSVKYILISGEVLPLSLVARATSALPHVKLLNLELTPHARNVVGSTEVSGDITWLEIQAPLSETELSLWSEHGVPIGKLQNRIGDTMLRLQVNESENVQLRPSAYFSKANKSSSAVEGELYAAGSALALGYTRERSPTLDGGSDGDAMKRWVTVEIGQEVVWFRTGDIIRVVGDCLFFCGRRDSLVKIRGQRIQLEAVERIILEAALTTDLTVTASTDRVLKVVVLAMKDPNSYCLTSQSLVAFLLIQGDSQSDSSPASSIKLREYPKKARLFTWVREKHGDAYVPRDAVVVPFTYVKRLASGKVDRPALRTLYETELIIATPMVNKQQQALDAPQDGQKHSHVKQFVIAQMSKALGIRSTGDDNGLCDLRSRTFQELGGNSLHATLFSWKLQQELGCTLPTHELLSTTLGEVVELLETRTVDQPHHGSAVIGGEGGTIISQADSTQPPDASGLERDVSSLPASPARKRPRHCHSRHLPEVNVLTKPGFWSLSRSNRTSAGCAFIPSLLNCSASAIAPLTIELVWQVDLEKCIDASPLVIRRCVMDDSTSTPTTTGISTWVAIGSHSTEFVCVDVFNSGRVVWKRKLDDRIEASASMSEQNGTLFVGTYSGALYALDVTTGAEKWVFRARDAIKVAVLVIDALQLVVCGAYDHKLYGIDSATGTKRWELEIADNGSLFSTPVYNLESSQLFYASTKGLVSCVALRDGYAGSDPSHADLLQPKQTWAHQLPAPVFSSLNISSPPPAIATVQLLLVGCADGNLYALDSHHGEIQWRVATNKPIFSSPCIYESQDRKSKEAVLFGSHDGVLRKVSCQGGQVVWSTELGNPIFSSPFVFEAVAASSPSASLSAAADETQDFETKRLMCCVATIDGSLFLCDEATGMILIRVSSSSIGEPALGELFSSPVVVDDLCLIGSRSNQLYAFRLA